MHYEYFEYNHVMDDEARVAFLQRVYEAIFNRVSQGSGRRVNRLLRFLRESDFYRVPCRHHQFVGGNAWHQLEVWLHAMEGGSRWGELDAMGVAVTCLLHDISNAGHEGATRVDYPARIRGRHGRKSTFILVDVLKFDLMFDENMAIIHHEHKGEDSLRDNTPNEADFEMVWGMPMYQMICWCDDVEVAERMTEARLMEGLHREGVEW